MFFSGSYTASKDKTCRSECKRNEQCDLGYACIRDGCRFICVKKVLPPRSIIADPLSLPGRMVASIPRGDVVPHAGNAGQVVGGVVDVDTGLPVTTDYPKDKTCRSQCKRNEQCDLGYACIRDGCRFICVRKVLPSRSIIADPLSLPGMMVANVDRGDVVVPYDGNAGQVVGGVVDVDTGLPVSTDYPKDKNIPIPSPDALNLNSRFPEAIPVGPGLGFNDRLFICIDHCVASTTCVEGADCVLGCKNMCENEQSSIYISPENPNSGIPIGNGPLNPIDTLTPVKKIDSYGKKDLLGQNAALINQQNNPAVHVDINGQLTPIDGTGSQLTVKQRLMQQFKVKTIDNYATTGLPSNKDILPGEHLIMYPGLPLDPMNTKIPIGSGPLNPIDILTPVKKIDSYGKKDLLGQNAALINQQSNPAVHVDINGQLTPIDGTGLQLTVKQRLMQQFKVKPIDKYATTGLPSNKDILTGEHLIMDPGLPLDPMNKGYPIGNYPINPIGKLTSAMPIDSNVNVNQHLIIQSALPVDSVGHVTQIGTNGARFNPHVPNSKGNALSIDLGMQINALQRMDSIHQRGSGQFQSNIPNIPHDNFAPPPFDLPVGVNYNGQIELIDQSIGGIEHGNLDLPVHVGGNIPLGGQFESNIPNIPHDNFAPPPFDLPVGVNYNGQIELIDQSIGGIEHGNPDLPVHVGGNIPLGGQFESNIPNIPHDNFAPPPFDLPVGVNSIGQIELIDQSIGGIEHGNPDLPVHVGGNIPLGGQFESNIPNIPHGDYVPPPFDLPVGVNSIGQIELIDQSIGGIEHGIPDLSVQVGRNIPLRPNKNLIPVAPRNCYKECNRDFHCGPQRVCVKKGCKRVCQARIDILPVLPIEPIVPNTGCIDQCISNRDCHTGMVCDRRPCRNICIKQTLKSDYKA